MTRLVFLGTRGEIEEYTDRHMYHSSLLLSSSARILIDFGELRRQGLDTISPDGLLITHAHPDHYAWLKENIHTEIPVYLTRETLDYGKFKPANARIVEPGEIFRIGPFEISAYRVVHSIRAPAVGYRMLIDGKSLVYNPDLVDIIEKDSVLAGVSCYIGDGSSIRANLVRRREDKIFGHARIVTQINWCRHYGIPNVLFTHLGKETIAREDEFKQEHPEVVLAYDGMELDLEECVKRETEV